jgi:hypothetical protein
MFLFRKLIKNNPSQVPTLCKRSLFKNCYRLLIRFLFKIDSDYLMYIMSEKEKDNLEFYHNYIDILPHLKGYETGKRSKYSSKFFSDIFRNYLNSNSEKLYIFAPLINRGRVPQI